MKLRISKLYVTRYNYVLLIRAYSVDDLPLLLARSSKAFAFVQLAILFRCLYRNNDCSTRLLRTKYAHNFYPLQSAISS